MKNFAIYLLLATSLILATSACDKVNKLSESLESSVKDKLQNAQDELVAENNFGVAYNHMISCDNDLAGSIRISSGSIGNAYLKYKKQNLAEATAKKPRNPSAVFSPDSFESCVKDLTEANKFNFQGDYVPIGNASKALLPIVESFGKTVKEMYEYIRSKAYIDDDFAKGRELDKTFLEQGAKFVEAFNTFDAELTKVEAIQNKVLVNSLKSANKMRSAYGYEAYGDIQQFLTLIDSGDPKKDEALAEKLNQLITATNDALTSMKEALEKTEDKKSSNLKGAYDSLIKMLGYMREAKQKGYSGRAVKDLVDDYNRFISFTLNMNRMDE